MFEHLGYSWEEIPRRSVAVTLACLAGAFGAHYWYVGQRSRALKRLMFLPVLPAMMFVAWFEAGRWILGDRRSFDEEAAAARVVS